ncbi:MAG TPA: prevent-host-death family protein [Oceanospirillaceae bacterium]|nr:prevent-host-death family protein [Oceanospirillaceae bacterium]
MFQSSDIYTVTEFSRKPAEHIKRLSLSKRPEILTVNGKASIVIQDAESYEKMAALADYAQTIQSLKQALTEDARPIADFTTEFERAQGIASSPSSHGTAAITQVSIN